MPTRSSVQAVTRAAFHRWPVLERLALGVLDRGYQLTLLPFRRRSVPGRAVESTALLQQTTTFNEAAERYFATFPNRQFLLDKPFSDSEAARHLIDTGILIDTLRLQPKDCVLEFGAGTCWLSHMLNRYGCRTVAVDVSSTALDIGRELFQRDPRTDWSLEPQFIAYDGYTMPLPGASCDVVVVKDAFHHVPNQRDVLRELHRVLKPDGMVFMSEPGYGHAASEHSRQESASGVLENELVLDDLAALARSCGFARVNVVVAAATVRPEIPVEELGAFMGGRQFARFWKALCHALEQHHYIVMYKSAAGPTTRRPARLSARIETIAPSSGTVAHPGEALPVSLRIRNEGDTRWLCSDGDGRGWTRVGAHLYRDGDPGEAITDWCRLDLPGDVDPGCETAVTGTLPPLAVPGRYRIVFDLVVEGLTWFADRHSRPASVDVIVEPGRK